MKILEMRRGTTKGLLGKFLEKLSLPYDLFIMRGGHELSNHPDT